MAKIVIKACENEISFEKVIKLIKKNWNLLASCISYYFLKAPMGKEIVRVEAFFRLTDVGNALYEAEGLVMQINELTGAITDIFREIEHQNPHFRNMIITIIGSPVLHKSLSVSFDIDVTVIPVMPVDSIDIPKPDIDNRAKQAEIMQLVH